MSDQADLEPICGATEARCECVAEPNHKGPHRCDEGCGGSWTFDEDGKFVVVSYPKATGEGRPRPGLGQDFLGDPWLALLAAGPIRAQRGAIRFINPPIAPEVG